jgi:hypothetical protein
MWSDGESIDPSPTIDQAINGGFPWVKIQCARSKTQRDVDLAAMKHPQTTFVHDLASRLAAANAPAPADVPRRPCYNWPGSRAILQPNPERCVGVDGLSSPRFYGALGVTARSLKDTGSYWPLRLTTAPGRAIGAFGGTEHFIIIAAGSEDVTRPTCPLDDALPVVFC